MFRINARPGIAHRYKDAICSAFLRTDQQLTRPPVDHAHCFGRVQDQVQNYLLQLNTVSLHGSQPLRQAGLDGNSILGDCASRQHDHLIDRLIEIKTMLSRRRFPDVITHPVDDDSCAVGIAYDTAERFPDFAEV
jgi:hypothetical protein